MSNRKKSGRIGSPDSASVSAYPCVGVAGRIDPAVYTIPLVSSRLTGPKSSTNLVITAAVALMNTRMELWTLAHRNAKTLVTTEGKAQSSGIRAFDFRVAGEPVPQLACVRACSSRPRPFFSRLRLLSSQTGAEKGAPTWSPPFPPEDFDDYHDDELGTPSEVWKSVCRSEFLRS